MAAKRKGGRGGAHLCLTSMVVTMSVLLASVSDTLMSRLVEFMAKVLLENHTPICHGGEWGVGYNRWLYAEAPSLR